MKIIKNEIHIGIEKPFSILHMTDTHLTQTDQEDAVRKAFAADRRNRYFVKADENLQFATEYAKKTGYQLIHTGDFVDFITPQNLKTVKKFADETGALMVAGNHELTRCIHNAFWEDDFSEELKIKENTLDEVQKFFNNDIRFFEKEISGVVLVGIDNSDYQIRPKALGRLKEIIAQGKPVVLFMHMALSTPQMDEKFGADLIAMPDAITNAFSEWQKFECKANAETKKAHDYILNQPLIKAIVAGHVHCDFETQGDAELKQFTTDIGTLREITIS